MIGTLAARVWPLAFLVAGAEQCGAPCKGPEHGRIEPKSVGERAGVEIELPPNTEIEFFEDVRLEIPEEKVTVTMVGPDGKEVAPPGEKPKPPPYPGDIIHLQQCYRWEIDVTQAGNQTHLSCDPMSHSDRCASTNTTGRIKDKQDCSIENCRLNLPEGGPTRFEALFHERYDCNYVVEEHVLRIVEIEKD